MDVLRRTAGKSSMDKIRNKGNNVSARETRQHRYYRKEKIYSGMAMSKECQTKIT